jgi:fucose permease
MQLLLFFPWRSNKDYVDAIITVFASIFSLIALIIVFVVFHDYLLSSLCHSMLSLPPLSQRRAGLN